MSFENYEELKAQIASFLWDRDDATAQIPAFVALAEAEMRRLLRTQQTTSTTQFTFSAPMIGLPCGAGSVKGVRIGDRDLDYIAPEQFEGITHGNSGAWPRFYTVMDDTIKFWPVGTSGLRDGTITYLDPFTPLSDTCDCNWVLKRHPDIYLSGALKWAKRWLVDQTQDWDTPFYSGIDLANKDNSRVQSNTTLRADELTIMTSRRRFFNVYTGGW